MTAPIKTKGCTLRLSASPAQRTDHGYTICLSLVHDGSPRALINIERAADAHTTIAAFGDAVRALWPAASFYISAHHDERDGRRAVRNLKGVLDSREVKITQRSWISIAEGAMPNEVVNACFKVAPAISAIVSMAPATQQRLIAEKLCPKELHHNLAAA